MPAEPPQPPTPGSRPASAPRGWSHHVPAVLAGLTLLLGLQLAGTVLVAVAGLPVPGAVVGLVALLVVGARWRGVVARVEPAGEPLLKHLQLLFVPPGVGALTQASTLVQNAAPLALAVVGSFAAGLVVAGVVSQKVLRRRVSA